MVFTNLLFLTTIDVSAGFESELQGKICFTYEMDVWTEN
jgi:hypothetical protein